MLVQILVPIVTLVLGVFLGAGYSQYLQRPRLRLSGSGGGGGPGPGYHQTHVCVRNDPGFLGIRISETVVFGKRIHPSFTKGLPVERNTAKECNAVLLDKASGEFVTHLWWRSVVDGRFEWKRLVDLASGESADLMLFARLDAEPTRYFPFDVDNEFAPGPRTPPEEAKFSDTHRFLVRITYSYGRQDMSSEAAVVKGYDGRLRWETEGGGGSF
jgi:hypothetical protein